MQDEQNPAKLYNHGNEYLHYEDDWCAAAYTSNVFECFRTCSDRHVVRRAWLGLGV